MLTKTVTVEVNVDVDADDFDTRDLIEVLQDRLAVGNEESRRALRRVPIVALIEVLCLHGLPPEIEGLLRRWAAGRLSLSETRELAGAGAAV